MPSEVADRPEGLAIGDYIEVRVAGSPEVKYYKILNRDPIMFVNVHSALSAGATETYTEISDLDPPDGEIYQIYAILVRGNVKVYIKQPPAVDRFGTNRSPTGGYLTDRISPVSSGKIINLWITKNNAPSVQIENPTNVTITPKLYWFGWKYKVEEVKYKPEIYTPIIIGWG
ncbi:MAG: hypothetical protein DRN25_00900 [Thermoplasmata archaeon]|nr:MAG: hypothetical protein DRN25_00900 [Thermoplasmata archaeon]